MKLAGYYKAQGDFVEIDDPGQTHTQHRFAAEISRVSRPGG
jgi:hypothetical protein